MAEPHHDTSSSSCLTSSSHGFVGVALQDQPMESSLSHCRRQSANNYQDMSAATDLAYSKEGVLSVAVQPSNSWPSQGQLEAVSRAPPGVAGPPFNAIQDKALLPCRYMKDQTADVPLHHLPPTAHPGGGLVSPMWGIGGIPYYGYQEPQMMHREAAPGPEPPRYDLLQDVMRQTINGGGYPPPNPRLMGQNLPPLQHVTYQPVDNPWVQHQPKQPIHQVGIPDYSQSNLSANDSFEAGASDGEYDDGADTRLDLPPTENPEDLVIEIDLSRKPETLQEAIAMYIDFLVLENDKKTHISECQLLPVRFDFEKEQYYIDVMSRPTPFPTDKFRGWLKLYNVDIEITDPQGNTASHTTFAPIGNAAPMPPNPPLPRPTPVPAHIMNWHMLNTGMPPLPPMPVPRMSTGEIPTNICPPLGTNMMPVDRMPPPMVPPRPPASDVRISIGIQCSESVEQQVAPVYESPPLYPPATTQGYIQPGCDYPEAAANAIYSAVCGMDNSPPADADTPPCGTDREADRHYAELEQESDSRMYYKGAAPSQPDTDNVICIAPISDSGGVEGTAKRSRLSQ